MSRVAPPLLIAALAAALLAAIAIGATQDAQDARSAHTELGRDGHRRTVGRGQVAFDGHGGEWWAARARRNRLDADELRAELKSLRKSLRREQRVLLARPNVVEALNLAAATYGYGSTLWRKARCETGGTFNPRSRNPSSGAAGLLQFLPSTWQTTPYARFSVWSPYANALAAGWMHEHGRGGEWSCR